MKPFLKWVGGKQKLLSQLFPLLPKDWKEREYVEPFVGGGAMFFHLASLADDRWLADAQISDTNLHLIETYEGVRDYPSTLLAELTTFKERHERDPIGTYSAARKMLNERITGFSVASLFIYLNKTCFNGLYRVNSKGFFNVPIGKYKNPDICNPAAIHAASDLLENGHIRRASYHELEDRFPERSFWYFDPPYDPVSSTSNFVGYAVGGFDREAQLELAKKCDRIDQNGGLFMQSNSDTPFIRQVYQDYNLTTIVAGRSINSKGSKRGLVNEIVIRNY